MWIADFREALRHPEDRKVSWFTVRNLVPVERCRDPSVGKRAYRVRRARGPIFCILVVVEKHAMTLFFPPFRTGQRGCPSLHCARKRYGRAAYLSERPARFDAYIYVHAARATSFRPAAKPQLVEQSVHFESDTPYIRPID